jgi:hypothetical protein
MLLASSRFVPFARKFMKEANDKLTTEGTCRPVMRIRLE